MSLDELRAAVDTAQDWQTWARRLVDELDHELAEIASNAEDGNDALRALDDLAERVTKLEEAQG